MLAPVGQHAAGEDARGFAGADVAGERPAGRDLADHAQMRGRARDVGGAHRIAVHGGDVLRRLGAPRREIFGQHAAFGVVERHLLGRRAARRLRSTCASASATGSSAMSALLSRR